MKVFKVLCIGGQIITKNYKETEGVMTSKVIIILFNWSQTMVNEPIMLPNIDRYSTFSQVQHQIIN